jgi:SAM-dependent methyltransferase
MQPYTNDYYSALRDGVQRSARVLVPLVLGLAEPRSVIDVGCGQGVWLSVFREHGIEDLLGVDGDYVEPDRLAIPIERFEAHELTRPLRVERTFDLAVSLEVAEHLPAESAEVFINSLTRLAPIVLFSAAAPYQGGESHLNEQWPAYWAERFGRHDYVPIDCLRRQIWNNPDVEWWYAQNTFLYAERGYLETHPLLRREYEVAGGAALAFVHPRRYLDWIEWGLSLCRTSPDAREGA